MGGEMGSHKIEYTTYNEYSHAAYADTDWEAERVAKGLRLLPHVSNVKVCGELQKQEVLAL